MPYDKFAAVDSSTLLFPPTVRANLAGVSPNYVINGSFDIWQRATSTTTTAAGYRTADRWATWIDSGAGTIQADTTNVPAFLQYGIRYTSSGASGSCVFYHTIETLNAELLAGKTVNLSAYLSGTAGKSIQISLWSSTTTDNAFSGSWSLVGATAYTNTTAVTRVSAAYNVPSNAKTIQVRVYNLDKLANTEFVSFTGVQLEEGSTATAFRRNANSIQGELAACQRYLPVLYGMTSLPGYSYATNQGISTFVFPVTTRTRPTSITVSAASDFTSFNSTNTGTLSPTIALNIASINSASIVWTSTLTAGTPARLEGNNDNGRIFFNGCEL